MRIRNILRAIKPAGKTLLIAIFWIGIWEAASLIIGKEILLPSPIRVMARLGELILLPVFHKTVSLSLFRILVGYLLGIILGILFAILTFKSKIAASLLSPVFTVIKATPVASIIILALVWIGKESVPSMTAALMVLPVIWANVIAGLRGISQDLKEVTQVYRFSIIQKIKILYIPSVFPIFTANAKTALGLAWKAGVAAEVLCTPKFSIGSEIYSSKLYLESVDLFTWTLTVIIMSLLLEFAIEKIADIPFRRKNGSQKLPQTSEV